MTTPVYCDPTKRHDFVFIFDVLDGNPNGDPDAGNLPRVDPETMQGIVTDVAIKRKIRDYVASMCGKSLYIQNKVALNTLYFKEAKEVPTAKDLVVEVPMGDEALKKLLEIKEDDKEADEKLLAFRDWLKDIEAEGLQYDPDPENERITYLGDAGAKDFKGLLEGERKIEVHEQDRIKILAKALGEAKKQKKGKLSRPVRDEIKSRMCAEYWDIRMFGAVLTAGTNAGQVRGPMQLTFSRSLHPVTPLDPTITRVAITKPADMLRKQTEMGRKPYVTFARYRGHGFYNPFLAEKPEELARSGEAGKIAGKDTETNVCGPRTVGKTYITEGDLTAFWEAFDESRMFREAKSASNGEMIVRAVYIFTHSDPKGDAASHRLFEMVETALENLKEGKERPDSPNDYAALPTRVDVQEKIEACDKTKGKITINVLCL